LLVVRDFVQKPDHELERLDDDALILYVREARAAGDRDAAGQAIAILVYGHWRNVERRVAMKIPSQHVEDVTGDVIISAIQSAFDGASVGEFVVWLATITRRRIADFHRRPRVETAPLGGESRERPGVEPVAPSEEGSVEIQDAIDRVLARLSEAHRDVVERRVFAQLPSAEVAAGVASMTVANVDQIASRFRRALRAELEGRGNTEGER